MELWQGSNDRSPQPPFHDFSGRGGWRRIRRFVSPGNLLLLGVLAILLVQYKDWWLPSPSAPLGGAAGGSITPDFILPDLEGHQWRLSQFRGSVVMLNFWATWCPPCQAEMPSIEALYRQYKGRGLVILAVSTDRQADTAVANFRTDRDLTFPILLDRDGRIASSYGVRGLPTTYVIDRHGKIVGTEFGARDWSGRAARQTIERLLNTTPAVPVSG